MEMQSTNLRTIRSDFPQTSKFLAHEETLPETASDGSDGSEIWTLSFRAEGPGSPVECRVRRLLKGALRRYGLRCTNYAVTSSPSPSPVTSPGIAHSEASAGLPAAGRGGQ
jgi:sugar phosphate isomerase/epimerase